MFRGAGKQKMLEEMGYLLSATGKISRTNTHHQPDRDITHFATRLHYHPKAIFQCGIIRLIEIGVGVFARVRYPKQRDEYQYYR